MEEFVCVKTVIDDIADLVAKRDVIENVCSDKFSYINLVDVYYYTFKEEKEWAFICLFLFFPFLFLFLANIADRYLSINMSDLAKRFKLSPTLAAITLIAFANGAPDILSSVQNSSLAEGNIIAIASLYGSFIFSITLVLGYVIMSTENDTQLPIIPVCKEIAFYVLSILVVLLFGYIGKLGFPFFVCYFIIYISYCIVTYYVEKMQKEKIVMKNDIEEMNRKKSLENETIDGGYIENEEDKTDVDDIKDERNFSRKVWERVIDPEISCLENILTLPLNAMCLFTICDNTNPFVQTKLRPLIANLSFIFILLSMNLLSLDPTKIAIVGGIGMISFILLDMFLEKRKLEIVYYILSILASIGWINIFAGYVVDCISFIAFWFEMSQVLISALLLSAGNTIGDLFANSALARNGEAVMGAVACYSGQLFNNYVGFGINALFTLNAAEFDLFSLKKKEMSLESIFLLVLILFALFLLLISFFILLLNKFVLKPYFALVLMIFYFIFFIVTVAFGILIEVN